MTIREYEHLMRTLEQSESYKNMTPIEKALALAKLNAEFLNQRMTTK